MANQSPQTPPQSRAGLLKLLKNNKNRQNVIRLTLGAYNLTTDVIERIIGDIIRLELQSLTWAPQKKQKKRPMHPSNATPSGCKPSTHGTNRKHPNSPNGKGGSSSAGLRRRKVRRRLF